MTVDLESLKEKMMSLSGNTSLAGDLKGELSEILSASLGLLDELFRNFESSLVLKDAIVFSIDDTLSASNNERSEVNLVTDADKARELFIFSIKKYFLLRGQNPKRTFRLPGIVNLGVESYSLLSDICNLKEFIYDCMQSEFLPVRERGKFFKTHVKGGVVLKELYRKPVLLSSPVKSLSFTWSNNVPLIHTVTKEAVLKGLKVEQDEARACSRSDKVGRIGGEIELIESLPSGVVLKKRRIVPPHPRVNIVYHGEIVNMSGTVTREQQVHGHLPVVLNSIHSPVGSYVIKGLDDNNHVQKKKRTDTIRYMQSLIQRLNLYRYA